MKFQQRQWVEKFVNIIRAPGPAKPEPGGTDSPRFCIGRDCLWDSKEQQREQTAQLICSLLLYGTRLPVG